MSSTPVAPGLKDAFAHRWRTAGFGSQSRLMSGVIALVFFVFVHAFAYVEVGARLSLVALALIPVAGYVLVRGWAYWSIPWLVVGIAFAFAVTAGPFYFL
ncbi:hypothetical protein BKA08_000411 [Nocardioides marinisabuli]|uniref:Uncharacterized protein n=1 Tax=Nocardioides marinisabuli TaxID=419476 RepID=A0A7Y9EY95_9ACTN|nr:hypothetical protein [Nocardioides marinisabuli]NYD56173.1 hypothetical protein [Nocardioides marinisabuli]